MVLFCDTAQITEWETDLHDRIGRVVFRTDIGNAISGETRIFCTSVQCDL